jgi:hypothetical protein
VCLLLNIAATISTLIQLEEWSRTSDLWLECSIRESFFTRNWEAYNLEVGSEVCSLDNIKDSAGTTCVSGCFYYPGIDVVHPMICGVEDDVVLENLTSEILLTVDVDYAYCDCGCDDYQPVKRPSLSTMTLSFLAQVTPRPPPVPPPYPYIQHASIPN